MRNFTKDHNELYWLFPHPQHQKTDSYSNEKFDEYERIAEELLKLAHEDKETFTRDDMIDAFMKGTSVAHQLISCAWQKTCPINEYDIRDIVKKLNIIETHSKLSTYDDSVLHAILSLRKDINKLVHLLKQH